MIIHDPKVSNQVNREPGIRRVIQDGNISLVRRTFSETDPCRNYLDREYLKVLSSCTVVLDGLVKPSFPESVSEVSICVMKQYSGGNEFLALEGTLVSENGKGKKETFSFSETLDINKVENVLKASFIQGKYKIWFEYIDQGVADYPLLTFMRRSKVFRKRYNKAAFECLPEFIPEN